MIILRSVNIPEGSPMKQHIILFKDNSWKLTIDLSEYIITYPLPKIRKIVSLIPEAESDRHVLDGFSILFECLDYLSNLTYNDDKQQKKFIKKLQSVNDYAMGLQSLYKGG